jgi:recombination protein RecT
METKVVEKKPEEQKNGSTLAKKEPSQSERFTEMVMKQFTNNAGELALTNFMKKLCQNYFIRIDQTLKDLEKKRLATKEQYRSAVAFDWKNVNLSKLAVDVVAHSAVGLDPTQPNQVNCIPYLNKSTSKFDIGFIIGFKGLELKVKKYALECPDDVVVELVFKNDKFKQIKKDMNNKVETYTFEIVDDFDRG